MAYTDEQRAEALEAYVQHGTAEASRLTGIHTRTIRRWANQAELSAARDQALEDGGERLAKTHRVMREELRVLLLERTVDMLERMDSTHIEWKAAGSELHRIEHDTATSADVKNYAAAVNTLIDKYRLEMGETTGRHQVSVEQVESSVDAELRKAIEEMRRQPAP